ncbi:hypothetical protein M408DRAFT_205137 [Serendipita vermifera MAFF 305830]|uniref:Thioesterase domain-containing protein n=1 Tax=Serendipita vermifera MAFF 305830 TaxID=933852 RepID=A0A0C3A4E5_SERVB|nr:hypothetical protein M408DRAFT_205137 [Serendipita vermifera MAFF 305830]
MTGVSTDINASFVRPAGKLDEQIRMETSVVGIGGNLAYTRTEFRDAAGKLVAFGSHTKFVGKTVNHPKNVKFSADGETVVEGEDILDDID